VEIAEWRNFVGWSGESAPCESRPVGEREKIVAISDPHHPYLDENALRECIRRDTHDADRFL
jgi:hypothetical protein